MQFALATLRTPAAAGIPTDPCLASPLRPDPEPQFNAAPAAAGRFDAGVDTVALNPQPLPPEETSLSSDLIASLPASLLDTVALNPQPLPPAELEIGPTLAALNPQPLPPQELPSTMNRLLSLPGGLQGLLSPSELLTNANVIGTVAGGLQNGAELQRHELWHEMARPAGQASFGGSARERQTLWNVIGDAPADGVQHGARDRVMPFSPGDYIGEVGTYPVEGDRMRAPLFVQGAGDADEVSMNDIKQGKVGDCYFMASLAAVAREHPEVIKNMVVDHGDGTYTVTFKERIDSSGPPQYRDHPITVTGDFPGGLGGKGHAGTGDVTKQATQEIWPPVFEKAYGQFINEVNPYATLDLGGHSRAALEAITGQPVKARGDMEDDLDQMGISKPVYLGPTRETFDELLADFQAGKAITVATSKTTQGLVPSHCYAVESVWRDADGRPWVQLYNPWGTGHPAPMPFEQLQALRIYTV